MKASDGWLIELDANSPVPFYLAADGNEDVHWTSDPRDARSFTTESAGTRFRDQHIDGAAVVRRHKL